MAREQALLGEEFDAIIDRGERPSWAEGPRVKTPTLTFCASQTLGSVKVDSILDHFWTPGNTM